MKTKKSNKKTAEKVKADPMTPVYDKARRKWRLSVPASLSPTGKRQRLFFENSKKASLEAIRVKSEAKLYGTTSTRLSATLSEDAAKADALIKKSGYDVTLTAIAQDWIDRKKEAEASCTLNELYDFYRAQKIKTASDLYVRDIDLMFKPLLAELGGEIVAHLSGKRIKAVMQKAFTTARRFANAYRTLRPAFTFAMESELCSANPFDSIKNERVEKAATTALPLAKVKALFNACKDFTGDQNMPKSYRLDCGDCAVAFALLTFAGIRPEELKRLQWQNVHLDENDLCIIIDGSISKTRSHRIIPISENLKAWIETIPASDRDGRVVPDNWHRKYAAVRHASGIKGEQQDILRHSFASYHLAAHSDFNALQSAMGHGTSEMILKHYKALIRKPDAIKFWSIRPNSTATVLTAVKSA
jgi:integrase/recombinase XerD